MDAIGFTRTHSGTQTSANIGLISVCSFGRLTKKPKYPKQFDIHCLPLSQFSVCEEDKLVRCLK
ncbi:hypothetical protein ACTXT7_009774 [Hymenolepis weldensis]